MKNPRSWGVHWSPSIVHSNRGDCEAPQCRSSLFLCGTEDIDYLMKYMVGYDSGVLGSICTRGAFIFECPKCFEKFWFHAGIGVVERLSATHPAWPK